MNGTSDNIKEIIETSEMDDCVCYVKIVNNEIITKGKCGEHVFAKACEIESSLPKSKKDREMKMRIQNAIESTQRSIFICKKYGYEKLEELRHSKFSSPENLEETKEEIKIVYIKT